MLLAWGLFILYLIGTSLLGYLGHTKTEDFSSFAIGDGKMSPVIVGITLAASTASAATFIVNPGFVYVHGVSAFLHLGVSVFIGILFMLYLMSFRFRKIGAENKAVTIPGWLGEKYKSKNFAIFFGMVNLLSFAFLVLLVGGISIVMQELLGINNLTALIIILVFVTSYVIIGGTYAHVFTNLLQGSLMILITLIILWTGIQLMLDTPDFFGSIAEINKNLVSPINPESDLYNGYFSIYISGFLIGAALICQPHILTKALYVKNDRDVSIYLAIFGVVYLLFTLLLLAGFWALLEVPAESLIDASTGNFRQDLVMTQYLKNSFPDWLFTLISIVLLAAAMSTLDGLLVGLSTITSNDFFINILDKISVSKKTLVEKQKLAFRASHVILIILAFLTFLVTLNPPKLLGIFGQFGVYALVLTSLPPLLNGIYYRQPSLGVVWTLSILALCIHVGLYFYGAELFPDSNLTFKNPAVPAGIAILCTTIPGLLIGYYENKKLDNA
jgi:SSS family solute:Na+ symporter/sodium/pantothenate symporter